MRSDERTYKQAMQYDPSKRTKEHEVLVKYLAHPEQIKRLFKMYLGIDEIESCKASLSQPVISMGSNYWDNNRSVYIRGYLDIFLSSEDCNGSIIIEVKSRKGIISDWIQQIRTYKSHIDGKHVLPGNRFVYVLACADPVSQYEIQNLKNNGIDFLYVGMDKAKKFLADIDKVIDLPEPF